MNTLHMAFAYNQSREKTNEGTFYDPVGQPYQNMQMAWYQYRNPVGFTVSALFVNLGFETGNPTPEEGAPISKKAYISLTTNPTIFKGRF